MKCLLRDRCIIAVRRYALLAARMAFSRPPLAELDPRRLNDSGMVPLARGAIEFFALSNARRARARQQLGQPSLADRLRLPERSTAAAELALQPRSAGLRARTDRRAGTNRQRP